MLGFFDSVNAHIRLLAAIFLINFIMGLGASRLCAEEIEVVTEYFQNYQLKTETGELDGFAVDVVKALFNQTGDKPSIRVLPWSRAYKIASENQNVMIFSIAESAERLKKFSFIGTLDDSPMFAWGLKSKFPEPIEDVEVLKSYYFVSIRNTFPDNILSSLKQINHSRVSTQMQLLGMIFKQRADLFVSSLQPTFYRAKQLGFDFNQLTPVYQFKNHSSKRGIAFSIQSNPALVARYREVFRSIEEKGEIVRLKQKWNVLE